MSDQPPTAEQWMPETWGAATTPPRQAYTKAEIIARIKRFRVAPRGQFTRDEWPIVEALVRDGVCQFVRNGKAVASPDNTSRSE